jgi:hypothetical protein
VHHSTLAWLELGDQRFRDVSCLTAADKGSSIDLSAYSMGFIGGDVLRRAHLWIDYTRRRIAFVPVSAAPPPDFSPSHVADAPAAA